MKLLLNAIKNIQEKTDQIATYFENFCTFYQTVIDRLINFIFEHMLKGNSAQQFLHSHFMALAKNTMIFSIFAKHSMDNLNPQRKPYRIFGWCVNLWRFCLLRNTLQVQRGAFSVFRSFKKWRKNDPFISEASTTICSSSLESGRHFNDATKHFIIVRAIASTKRNSLQKYQT